MYFAFCFIGVHFLSKQTIYLHSTRVSVLSAQHPPTTSIQIIMRLVLASILFFVPSFGSAFITPQWQEPRRTTKLQEKHPNHQNEMMIPSFQSTLAAIALGVVVLSTSGTIGPGTVAWAADGGKYDGFAEYAKENQMEQSDVACFVQKCGDQTKRLFSNPRGIKGITCLGQCKGEQACATRCFAEFGSEDLNDWLSCTIEENACVKVPKNIDNSAENIGYPTAVKRFDPTSLIGTWYKTDGLKYV